MLILVEFLEQTLMVRLHRGGTVSIFPFVVAAWLLLVGLYGVVTSRNLIHLIVCLSGGAGVDVRAAALDRLRSDVAPRRCSSRSPSAPRPSIRSCRRLTLTDIVVGATVSALLLALAVQVHKRSHTLDPARLTELQG